MYKDLPKFDGKFNLARFDAKINVDEGIEEVTYYYKISDSSGQLQIENTMIYGKDEVENFIYCINRLYRLDHFTVINKRFKYTYDKGLISKYKMY